MKKVLLIIGGVVVGIIIIAAVLFYFNKDKIAQKGVDMMFQSMEQMITANLPQDVAQDSVKVMISTIKSKILTNEIDMQEFKNLMIQFNESMSNNELDSLEVKSLIEQLNKLQ